MPASRPVCSSVVALLAVSGALSCGGPQPPEAGGVAVRPTVDPADTKGTAAGMAKIPAGTFAMGDADSSKSVAVAAFEMDVTEVTVAAYTACVKASKCAAMPSGGDCNFGNGSKGNHPVTCGDWNEAQAYCNWAGKRLPTEEEWEYAARGTDGRTYPWGNEAPDSQLCWKREDGTCPVGSHPAGRSPFGLDDMSGNVWEWTSSDPDASTARVLRGGAWNSGAASTMRCSDSVSFPPSFRDGKIGFRCARGQ